MLLQHSTLSFVEDGSYPPLLCPALHITHTVCACLSLSVLGFLILFHRQNLYISFDEEFIFEPC